MLTQIGKLNVGDHFEIVSGGKRIGHFGVIEDQNDEDFSIVSATNYDKFIKILKDYEVFHLPESVGKL